jgi:16S rRNA (cytosine967-C5)-methyltransferase
LPSASSSPDPRVRAATVLARVDAGEAFAARLLGDAGPAVREMVLGTLRWQRTLDWLIARFLKGSSTSLEPAVRAVLRLGLYEARRLDTPVPVAVAEAVRVAKQLAPRAAGLVNAVLRRAVVAPWPEGDDAKVPLGVRFSHPDWLVNRWRRLLGEEAARLALAANQEPAPLCLLDAASDPGALAAAGCTLEPHPWAAGVSVVRAGAAEAVAALVAGQAYAMDPAAAVVARLLPVPPGAQVVDLAAAPGGKALLLCRERDLQVLALDRHLGRTVLMRANLARVADRSLPVAGDAARPPLRPGGCGAVLLDAPCSGTGTLRRHPEARWRLGEPRLGELAALQRELLAAAARLLRPDGLLLYSTCSIEPEENAGVVATSGLAAVPLGPLLPPGVPRVELPGGGVVIPPNADSDGFTAHLLRSGP